MSTDTALPADLVDLVGPVGVQEFAAVADRRKPDLIKWTRGLAALSDDEILTVARQAIYDSALGARFQRGWEPEHYKATVCYREAKRRLVAAGHDEDCCGETLYSRAYAQVVRENGHTPPAPGTCECAGVRR